MAIGKGIYRMAWHPARCWSHHIQAGLAQAKRDVALRVESAGITQLSGNRRCAMEWLEPRLDLPR